MQLHPTTPHCIEPEGVFYCKGHAFGKPLNTTNVPKRRVGETHLSAVTNSLNVFAIGIGFESGACRGALKPSVRCF